MKKFVYIISTGFFSGLVPTAPGTAGSLAALAIAATLSLLLPAWAPYSLIGCTLVLAITGIPISSYAASHIFFKKDPSPVVIDEFAGMFLSICLVPFTLDRAGIITYTGAFLLFRLLDIAKPPGINELQRLKGGWGIMLDDLGAGALTLTIVMIARRFLLA